MPIKSSPSFKTIRIITYVVLFIITAFFVFRVNDETLPFTELLTLNYLIPVMIYASGAIGLSILLYKLISIVLSKTVAFPVSILIGMPAGILMVHEAFSKLAGV